MVIETQSLLNIELGKNSAMYYDIYWLTLIKHPFIYIFVLNITANPVNATTVRQWNFVHKNEMAILNCYKVFRKENGWDFVV